MAFRTLLYRYFFFGWLFRDVTRGNLFERSAAWAHNKSQAHWLLTYMSSPAPDSTPTTSRAKSGTASTCLKRSG